MDKKRKELMRGTIEDLIRNLRLSSGAAELNVEELNRSSRKLKNELIGNSEKKKALVESGSLPLTLELIGDERLTGQTRQNLIHVVGSVSLEDGIGFEEHIIRSAIVALAGVMADSKYSSQGLLLPAAKALINLLKHRSSAAVRVELSTEKVAQLASAGLTSEGASSAELRGAVAEAVGRLAGASEGLRAGLAVRGDAVAAWLLGLVQQPLMPPLLGGLQALVALLAIPLSLPLPLSLVARLQILTAGPLPLVRMLAAHSLALLKRTSSSAVPRDLWLHALLVLVQLVRSADPAVADHAPLVLASLVETDTELARAAVHEADAITPLAQLFAGPLPSERAAEGALRALAALCTEAEESRRAVAGQAALLAQLSAGCGGPSGPVRLAALATARALSRGHRPVRAVLADSAFLTALLRTLAGAELSACQLGLATLCNLVLDFAPMKRALLELGFVPPLLRLADCPPLLRHVLWVFKNTLMHSDTSVRTQLMAAIGYPRLVSWLEHGDAEVAVQALGVLRNLMHAEAEQTVAALTPEVLSRVLAARLGPSTASEVLTQALYVVSNWAAGAKEAVLASRPLLVGLLASLDHPSAAVRVAAAWALHNLSLVGRGQADPLAVARLKQLNFHTRLQLLQATETSLDVLDRIAALRWVSAIDSDK